MPVRWSDEDDAVIARDLAAALVYVTPAVPVALGPDDPGGIAVRAARGLPPGGRRAGLLAHRFNAQLIGLESRQHTGRLEAGPTGEGRYAPHIASGFKAPANKTVLLLGSGYMANRNLRRTRRSVPA